jgi:hypothetical protein
MLRRIIMVLAAGALMVPLAACDLKAQVECRPGSDGKVICEGDATYTPPTPTAPPTTQPTKPPAPTTQPPATTEKPDPTEGPEPTAEPDPEPSTTAAARYGWGSPALADEFNYVGAPNPQLWGTPLKWGSDGCGEGHGGNGRRCHKNSVVDGSKLVMSGDANGDTGWLKLKSEVSSGRWEARARSYNVGSSGDEYHPLFLIWPTSEKRVQDGEYDWLENGAPGENCIEGFLHYPGETPKKQEHVEDCNVPGGLDEWHNIAFEWTPDHLKGFIDGRQWFSLSNDDIEDMPKGHLNIQLDNFHGDGMRPAKFEVDWIRYYKV